MHNKVGRILWTHTRIYNNRLRLRRYNNSGKINSNCNISNSGNSSNNNTGEIDNNGISKR